MADEKRPNQKEDSEAMRIAKMNAATAILSSCYVKGTYYKLQSILVQTAYEYLEEQLKK